MGRKHILIVTEASDLHSDALAWALRKKDWPKTLEELEARKRGAPGGVSS